MKTFPLILLIGVLFVIFSINSFAQSLPEKFESWNEVQLIVPLKKGEDRSGKTIDKWTLTLNGIARAGRRPPDLVDGRVGVSLEYRASRHVTLLTNLLYRRDENTEGVKRYETRLDLGATLSKSFGNLTVRNRAMYECRFRNGRGDIQLYRNRVYVSYPIKKGETVLFTPFVSDEGYYDMTGKTWSQNEFYAGISRKLSSRTTLDVAYVRNDTRPTNVNGLSLTLKIRLLK